MVPRSRKRSWFLAVLWGLVACLVSTTPAWARTETFYRGIGAHGEVFFTDNPAAIPAGEATRIQVHFRTPQPAAKPRPTAPSPATAPSLSTTATQTDSQTAEEAVPPVASPPPVNPEPHPEFVPQPYFRQRDAFRPERSLVPRQDPYDPNYVWIGRYRYAKKLFHFPNVSLEQERELRERYGPLLGFPTGKPTRSPKTRSRRPGSRRR